MEQGGFWCTWSDGDQSWSQSRTHSCGWTAEGELCYAWVNDDTGEIVWTLAGGLPPGDAVTRAFVLGESGQVVDAQ